MITLAGTPKAIVVIKLPPRCHLPHDRSELGPENRETLSEEVGDAFLTLREFRPHHAEARALDCKLETVGNGFFPSLPALGLLAAVEGRVDLNCAELV